jgi:ketosteroid isomerase-like protein
MKRLIFLLTILCCCLAFAREDSDYWRQLLKPYSDEFGGRLQKNDLEGILDSYDDDVILIRPFSPPLQGKEALKQEIKEARRIGFKYESISGETIEVWGCEDQIFERGTLAFSYTTKQNAKPQAYYGSYIAIWQKQDDSAYRIKYSLWNLDFNPWEN